HNSSNSSVTYYPHSIVFFLIIPQLPSSTLFPYTTLFRSGTSTNYYCPMHCEGNKTYNKPGDCPVCNMHLIPVNGIKIEKKKDGQDRKSTRLNSSHVKISYAVFCLKKKSR